MARVEFPEKLQLLFRPKRYKVMHGGRGGGKSWGVARALLILGAQKPLRVLCAREVQKSIKDSVHRLLCDQIESLGLSAFYEILETEIRGPNGTLFLFAGLAATTVESIKSFEGVDIVWVEEARNVAKRSWEILLPTIRKSGSEIWVTFNPEFETDDTYQRFVANPPDDCEVVQINWSDNPFLSAEANAERINCMRQYPDDYQFIWEGKCRPAVSGAIYYNEMAECEAENRICRVKPDPLLKTHVVFDLGWNDSTSIALVQQAAGELRIVDYIEDSQRTLDWYSSELRRRDHQWGTMYLPHDSRHKSLQTGKSAEMVMQALGWQTDIVPNIDVESGIRTARMAFKRTVFDRDNTGRLVECLKRYRRTIPQTTGEPGNPLHDEYSHGADCFRYVCLVADRMSNETWGGALSYPQMGYA
ncbi:MAG: PBSX family phage terminase large subunit [Desulfurellales bacterium]|nr:MAG: PBSX family phage terminase large subunit [Desulfurellales bacterium]